jgi:hypothetical protein
MSVPLPTPSDDISEATALAVVLLVAAAVPELVEVIEPVVVMRTRTAGKARD